MDSGTSSMIGTGVGAGAGFFLGGPAGAMLGAKLGGAVGGLLGSDEAAKARKRAALEQLRRDDMERARTMGKATVAAGASGFEGGTSSSSLGLLLGQMDTEFKRQHDWQYQQAQRGEQLAQDANRLSFVNSVGSALFKFGDANSWWQAKPQVS